MDNEETKPTPRKPGRPKGSKDSQPRKSPLTRKQSNFIKAVRELTPPGELPTATELQAAALKAYDCKDTDTHSKEQIASTIANQNLKKDKVWEELAGMGINEDARKQFRSIMWGWLLGEDNQHPRNLDLKMKAAQLLAKGMIPQEEHSVQEISTTFENKSVEELEFFADHGVWPNSEIGEA